MFCHFVFSNNLFPFFLFQISGFQPPNAAVLFDVHTQFKTPTGSSEVDGTHSAEKPEREWTYVNQYIVDKGR